MKIKMNKLSDFVERFWHFDLITSMNLEKFAKEYLLWAKEKKYHRSRTKAEAVYELASSGIPTLSSSPSWICTGWSRLSSCLFLDSKPGVDFLFYVLLLQVLEQIARRLERQ